MAWVLFRVGEYQSLIYFIGLVDCISGIGRLYSRIKLGSAGRYFDTMLVVEILLGFAIVLVCYFRFHYLSRAKLGQDARILKVNSIFHLRLWATFFRGNFPANRDNSLISNISIMDVHYR